VKRGAAHGLRKARRSYRRRNFTLVINFLEPQVFMYRDSYEYYYLLGMSCLYTGDYSGGYSYLRRALDIDERVNAMLGLAAVLLRRREMDKAIRAYLDVLDVDQHNRRARRALGWLRSMDDPESVVEWFESRRVRRILPRIGPFLPSWVGVPVGVAAAAAIVVAVGPVVVDHVSRWFAPPDREGTELVSTEGSRDQLVTEVSDARYTFTEGEAARILTRIGDYFNDRRDNLVRRELNRIALSNADAGTRERALLLRDYLVEPDFTTLRDNFPYPEVFGEPDLYDGVYVRWRGRVTNLEIGTDAIRFEFLAGYESRRVLDGIVPARVEFAVLLENDQAVELIGQVERQAGGIALRVTSIRTLAPSEITP
jgi:tetratricopeptide (TPR) repeat protein